MLVSPGTDLSVSKKMDNRASPVKDSCFCDDDQKERVARIKKSAPGWFTEAFTFIIDTIKTESLSANTTQRELESKIDSLEKRIVQLEEEKKKEQSSVISKLQADVDNLEAYSRRENLLIDGIQESPNEDIQQKTVDFL